MRKIYDIILCILIISAIVVTTLIIIKYGKNRINENEISEKIVEIEKKLENSNNNEETIEEYYKGYKIVGIIEIPKIEIKYPILNETTDAGMKIAITRFFGEINQIGNFTVAGHNNRDGTMFGKTRRLEIGDIIKLTDMNNNTVEYKIFKIYSIDPNDVSITESVEKDKREVTLITCTNGHKERLIVKAREIEN